MSAQYPVASHWEQESFPFKIQQKQSVTVWQKQDAPNLPMIQRVFLNSYWDVSWGLQQRFKPCRETPEAQAFLPASVMVPGRESNE